MDASSGTDALVARARAAVTGLQPLRLLVLHGSHAEGAAHAGSDIDFAYLADAGLDTLGLASRLVDALGTEHIDLADLSGASALLRIRVAQHGVPVLERQPGAFDDFRLEASLFWCDVEPILRAAQEGVLRSVAP